MNTGGTKDAAGARSLLACLTFTLIGLVRLFSGAHKSAKVGLLLTYLHSLWLGSGAVAGAGDIGVAGAARGR